MKGTTLLLPFLTLLEGYLPPRRSLANIEYRLYEAGDIMEGQKLDRCKEDPCYVAVDLGTSEKTVIGIIEMTIPSRTLEKSLEKLIRAAMPKPTEAGKIGYINYVEVLSKWQGQGIGKALITSTFGYIATQKRDVVAMYLLVQTTKATAIALYEKTKFKRITQENIYYVYARYDFT
ncbi:hypothetical protein FOZ60_002608 [Perkinsus olseni]|uniref:N-alpha-acetyltransferase 60 n=1 Tax=Perkinsus olseni TaxID=32597 RepID=A0A7J6NZR2_PEROL|nr:hypothetical protein FOZ60_002608 [Perkinsus olseni]